MTPIALAVAKATHPHPPPLTATQGAVVIGSLAVAVLVWRYVSRTGLVAVLAMTVVALTPAFGEATPKARAYSVGVAALIVILLGGVWRLARHSAARARAQENTPAPRPAYYQPYPVAPAARGRGRRGR